MNVQTVRGPVSVDELGYTLMHEHVFLQHPERDLNRPEYWENERLYQETLESLEKLYEQGIRTIVDLSVRGIGQSIPLLKRVAPETRINIIAATGFYTWDKLPMMFRTGFRQNEEGWEIPDFTPPGDGEDPMFELFIRDIEHGIENTGVRPAILKCATEVYGVTEGIERVLRVVARTHRRTGVPITTHSHAESRRGIDQQGVFAEEGVDLSRVIIGHSDDSKDLSYLREVMDRGSYIGMDRFGTPRGLSFHQRIDTVAALCHEGYAPRIVLSHDSICHHSGRPTPRDATGELWTWFRMLDEIVPGLRKKGVTDDDIDQMLLVNPREIFSQQAPY